MFLDHPQGATLFLAKITFLKYSQWFFSYINLVLWQHVILCKLYVTESAPGDVHRVLCNWRPQLHNTRYLACFPILFRNWITFSLTRLKFQRKKLRTWITKYQSTWLHVQVECNFEFRMSLQPAEYAVSSKYVKVRAICRRILYVSTGSVYRRSHLISL